VCVKTLIARGPFLDKASRRVNLREICTPANMQQDDSLPRMKRHPGDAMPMARTESASQ
jgi:hypothetical protein